MLTAIRNWVIRTMMKSKGQTGVVQTIPKRDIVEINTQITAQRLMQNGIDPTQLKNADQVENAIIAIESRPKVQEGIKSTGKIFDMEGKEINPRSKIMEGKQSETDAEIKARLDKSNKEGLSKIRSRQKMLDDAINDVSPGFSGDRTVDAELVAENLAERMGKVYDDLPTKERLKIYDEAFQGLTKKKFNPQDMAQGGRAGFDNGGLLSMLDIQAAGSKSGKQQIMGAPEGFTMDNETYNFIINADIPIGEKINLLTKYSRGKGRTRIEKDDQELILGEGGSRNREIGLGFNPNAEKVLVEILCMTQMIIT